MPKYVSVPEFLKLAETYSIVDVRSPAEHQQGHVPDSINVPLFSNEQRAEVGTLFKQSGRQESVLRSLEIVGPKLNSLAKEIAGLETDRTVLLHCWRGGMRSGSVAWLAEQMQLNAFVLQGGYKAYRRHVLESFKQPIPLLILSGLTGAGKTKQLWRLRQKGEQVVDLEQLANHRGSTFGGIDQGDQPSVEHFENQVSHQVGRLDHSKRIWVEDESRNVGAVKLPHHFFDQMRKANAIFMNVDRQVRIRQIYDEYGRHSIVALRQAIERISKRLGGQNVKDAIDWLNSGRIEKSIGVLLDYYDKNYLTNKARMVDRQFFYVDCPEPVSDAATNKIIEMANRATQN